jgi:RNA polymerase sigma-70 factor (sigma-E family)
MPGNLSARSSGVKGVTDWTDFADYVGIRREAWVRAAYLLVGDVHQAEDLVQGTLIRVWPHWRRISAQGDPDAYVRKAIFHQFSSFARTRRWRELSDGLLPGTQPAGNAAYPGHTAQPDTTGAVDTRLQLRETLAALAPRQRAVLVLRYYLDLSEAETASVLGCSIGTVKSQASKALKHLRALESPGAEPGPTDRPPTKEVNA